MSKWLLIVSLLIVSSNLYGSITDTLIKKLHSTEKSERLSAAKRLAVFSNRDVVIALAGSLDDKAPEVREQVAHSLVLITEKLSEDFKQSKKHEKDIDFLRKSFFPDELLDALHTAFYDEDSVIRMLAAYSLINISDPRSSDIMLKALRDDNWNIKMESTTFFTKVLDKRSIPPLTNLIMDPQTDATAVINIIYIFDQLKAYETVDVIVNYVLTDEWVGISPDLKPIISQLIENYKIKKKDNTLSEIDQEYYNLWKASQTARLYAIRFLEKSKSKKVIFPLIKVIEQEDEISIRNQAIKSLSEIDYDKSLTTLARQSGFSDERNRQLWALKTLSLLLDDNRYSEADIETINIVKGKLKKVVTGDNSDDVRVAGLLAISNLIDDDVLSFLKKMLNSRNPEVSGYTAVILSSQVPSLTTEILIRSLFSSNPELQKQSLSILSQYGVLFILLSLWDILIVFITLFISIFIPLQNYISEYFINIISRFSTLTLSKRILTIFSKYRILFGILNILIFFLFSIFFYFFGIFELIILLLVYSLIALTFSIYDGLKIEQYILKQKSKKSIREIIKHLEEHGNEKKLLVYYDKLSDSAKTISDYKRIVDIKTKYRLSISPKEYEQAEQYEEALLLYEKENSYPEIIRIKKILQHKISGEIYEKAGKIEDAIASYKSEGNYDKEKQLTHGLSKHYEENKRWKKALKLYESTGNILKIVEMKDKLKQSCKREEYHAAGVISEKNKEYDKALSYYKKAKSHDKVIELYSLLQLWNNLIKYKTQNNLPINGLEYYHNKNYTKAVDYFLKEENYDKALEIAFESKDDKLIQRTKHSYANFQIQNLEDIPDKNVNQEFELGNLYFETKEYILSISQFQKVLTFKNVSDRLKQDSTFYIISCLLEEKALPFSKGLFPVSFAAPYKDLLYKLGGYFIEEQRFNEALSVYEIIYDLDVSYKDVAKKINQMKVKISQADESFVLNERIMSGANGTIWKALDKQLNRTVAIKIPHIQNADYINELKIEAEFQSRLTHPNIVQIYRTGIISKDNTFYIMMEYVDGSTLRDELNKNEPFKLNSSISIILQIASALSVAHSNDIIHRDIKPDNILITKDGIAKLTDFGLAKSTVEFSTSVLSSKGTTPYMAPEQIKGKATKQSDIWSLGTTSYEILTGKQPFDGNTDWEITQSILNSDIKPISYFRNDVPPKLIKIIQRMLTRNTSSRYSSINNIVDDLNNLSDITLVETGNYTADAFTRYERGEFELAGDKFGHAFEELIRRMEKKYLEIVKHRTVMEVIKELKDNEYILPEHFSSIDSLREYRNTLVHHRMKIKPVELYTNLIELKKIEGIYV